MFRRLIAFSILFGLPLLYGADSSSYEDLPVELQIPWTTGPILTPSARTIPKGHINFQPYVFYSDVQGHFDNHWKLETAVDVESVNFETWVTYGLTDWMDVTFMGQFFSNMKDGKSYTALGNSVLGFDFQLVKEDPKGFTPGIKFLIFETFPTGSYNDLDFTEEGLDVTGDGSYSTKIGIVFGKTYHIKDFFWVNTRYSFGYFYFSPVKVRGFNTFGGGFDTAGTITRWGSIPISVGVELTLTRNLAVAFDILSLIAGPNTFEGNPGYTDLGIAPAIGNKRVYQLSVAPAVEWSFSPQLGLILGGWFSLYGHNADNFSSLVFSINIYK
ncbi:MAG: hypothetical protein FJZ60_03100 [Chlamydiae bacterium]|nr:hypothetical protein [Chlamydiota bacterium]